MKALTVLVILVASPVSAAVIQCPSDRLIGRDVAAAVRPLQCGGCERVVCDAARARCWRIAEACGACRVSAVEALCVSPRDFSTDAVDGSGFW